MALPSDTFTASDLATHIPEIWGTKINEFYESNLVAAPHFTDRSDELAGGGDILHTPSITEMSGSAKGAATAVTLVSPTETSVDLTVATWIEVSFMIEDKEAAQVLRSYNTQERYAKKAAYSCAKSLDTALVTLFNSFSQEVGTTTVALTDTVIREAIEKYTAGDVPIEDAAFFFAPKTIWSDIMGIDKFSLIQNTAGADPVMKGAVGMLYGIPVFSSTNITKINANADYSGALASKDSVHFATGNLPGSAGNVRVQANYMPEYLSTLYTADILYGVIENRDAAGIEIISAV